MSLWKSTILGVIFTSSSPLECLEVAQGDARFRKRFVSVAKHARTLVQRVRRDINTKMEFHCSKSTDWTGKNERFPAGFRGFAVPASGGGLIKRNWDQ